MHPDAGLELDLAGLVKRAQQQAAGADAFGRVSLLLFLLYPMITNKIFKAFDCRDLGSEGPGQLARPGTNSSPSSWR